MGILIARHGNQIYEAWAWSLLCASLFLAIIIRWNKRLSISYHRRWMMGVSFLAVFMSLGYLLYIKHDARIQVLGNDHDIKLLMVLEKPVEKRNSMMLIMEMISLDSAQENANKVLCYFQKDSLVGRLRYGDRLLVRCHFQGIERSQVPWAFDYAWWMHKQHIATQTYVKKGAWLVVDNCGGTRFGRLTERIREHVMSVFNNTRINTKGRALLSALLLGDKHDIDPEQKMNFQRAGVLHVLAVSGLHVGILYLFVSGMLFFLKRNRFLKIVRSLVIWSILGIFALVAGLSPSVVRAVLMFFLFDVGMLIARRSSVYNIIASSAFVIVLIDPHTLFEAGFWLSYCAVISIITFFPFVQNWVTPKNGGLKKIRDLLALSISVQPGTAPISIYLFNQFPIWFLLSNIVAVPMVGLLIYLAFTILILDMFSVSCSWLFSLLQGCLDVLDGFLNYVAHLPFASITNINLGWMEMILLLLGGLLVGWMFWMKDRKMVIYVIAILNVVLGLILIQAIFNRQNKELLVFHQYHSTAVYLKHGPMGVWIQALDSNMHYNALAKYEVKNGIKYTYSLCELDSFEGFVFRVGCAKDIILQSCSNSTLITQRLEIRHDSLKYLSGIKDSIEVRAKIGARTFAENDLGRRLNTVFLPSQKRGQYRAISWAILAGCNVWLVDSVGVKLWDLDNQGCLDMPL